MYLSKEEKERRYTLLKEAMAKEDLKVLLVMGNNNTTGSASWSTGSFRYLSDFFIFSYYGVLLFFVEEDPIMLIPMELLESRAKKFSWVEDVRISLNYPQTVAGLLEERGLAHGKIGIVAMESTPTPAYLSLRERLPMAEFVEASSMVLQLRFVKSEEERNLMQKAARLNDQAYEEVLKHIKPGIKEYEIVGILEGYHRMNGADKTFNIISSGPFPTSKEGTPFQGLPWCPTDREIRKGDCILLEMTNAYGGYWNQLVRVVSVGHKNSELLEFHKAAVLAIQKGLDKLKVGMRTSEYFAIMARTAEECGYKLTTPMGHFVGLDLVEARVEAESQVVISPGLAFIIHPNITDSKKIRILWGQTYFMTPEGPVSLNQTETDILHIV